MTDDDLSWLEDEVLLKAGPHDGKVMRVKRGTPFINVPDKWPMIPTIVSKEAENLRMTYSTYMRKRICSPTNEWYEYVFEKQN